MDDMIKIRSANVSRLEAEAALAAIAGVDLAIVAGIPERKWARGLSPPSSRNRRCLSEEELRASLRQTL
jgi:acyl-CoA synthetase (AMP-forming)/AMP-acid ligase II